MSKPHMMMHESPLRKCHDEYIASVADEMRRRQSEQSATDRPGAARAESVSPPEIEYLPYAAPEAEQPASEIVGTFGEIESEYAALRRGAGLFDATNRGTIVVTGSDRIDFLNRMLTQDLKDLTDGTARAGFWLNRKGRIESDVLLAELNGRIIMAVDITRSEQTVALLNEFLFTEDVQLTDSSADFHHLILTGREAPTVLAAAVGNRDLEIAPMAAARTEIAGITVDVIRNDDFGEATYELVMPHIDEDGLAEVWRTILKTDYTIGEGKRRVRPVGWYALNIARIEAGTPCFNVDFGTNTLPHESGLIDRRVSFTKGCFPGQEVVARMQHLGKPARVIVGFRMQGDLQPVAGSQVFATGDDIGTMGPQIGIVTSSTLSPMLGAASIGFAMLKSSHAEAGTEILVNAEGEQGRAVVTPLRFWSAEEKA